MNGKEHNVVADARPCMNKEVLRPENMSRAKLMELVVDIVIGRPVPLSTK